MTVSHCKLGAVSPDADVYQVFGAKGVFSARPTQFHLGTLLSRF